MLCIAAFLVLLVLGAVSAKYRPLLKKAWHCVTRRVTFRPCDTTFGEEVKNSLLAPLAIRAPRLVKPVSVAIGAVAWVMVLSMVISVYVLLRSGLFLAVYGTCSRANPEACSLTAEACGIQAEEPGFLRSLTSGDVVGAFRDEFGGVGEALATIPGRFRHWDASEYLPDAPSFRGGYREGLPVALEILDPGCATCAHLFQNMTEAGFGETHNLSYLPYTIMSDGQPHFANSLLVTQYLTGIRLLQADQPEHANNPGDWFILEQIFTGYRTAGVTWQFWLNELATPQQVSDQLHEWLAEDGYSPQEIAEIAAKAQTPEVEIEMERVRDIVENQIRTVKIPTLIANGSLHRGLVAVDRLKTMAN